MNNLLYIPPFYEEHRAFIMPSFLEIFGNDNPVVIEYCSGNGEWVINRAKNSPFNWIAVEKRIDRASKILPKRGDLKNLLIVYGEALTFTKFYLPPSSIESIYINFPDPWPKRRHIKHRLITEQFALELKRVLKCLGQVTLVTDDVDAKDRIKSIFIKWPLLQENSLDQCPDYGTSFFQRLWSNNRKTIFHLVYKDSLSLSIY